MKPNLGAHFNSQVLSKMENKTSESKLNSKENKPKPCRNCKQQIINTKYPENAEGFCCLACKNQYEIMMAKCEHTAIMEPENEAEIHKREGKTT
jgi:hypothetical protein